MNRRAFLATLGAAVAAPFVPTQPVVWKTKLWTSPGTKSVLFSDVMGGDYFRPLPGQHLRGIKAIIEGLPPFVYVGPLQPNTYILKDGRWQVGNHD